MNDPIIKALTIQISETEPDIELMHFLSQAMKSYENLDPKLKALVVHWFNDKYRQQPQ